MGPDWDFSPCRPGFQDHVAKVEHGVEVPVRVWPAKGSSADKPAPWLLWIHGGGFQGGNPYGINRWVHLAFEEYHIVSAAYRFMPQVDLFGQVQDCKDAYDWARANLPKLVDGVDVDSCVVAGDSAGGTLSMLMGFHLSSPPTVVVELYGPTDVTDSHYRTPAPRYGERLALDDFDEREPKLVKAYHDRDPAHARTTLPWAWELPPLAEEGALQTYWGKPDYKVDDEDRLRMDLYNYVGLEGKRIELLLRGDEVDEAEFKRRVQEASAVVLLDKVKTYPPTYILHGTGDTLVPVTQGRAFEAKLKKMGVDVAAAYPEGLTHAFDATYNDRDAAEYAEIIEPLFQFVDRHVKAARS